MASPISLGSLPLTAWMEILKEFESSSRRLQDICAKYGGGEASKGSKKSKKKRKKKEKDENEPKRPLTGYMRFCSANRDNVKQSKPKIKPQEIMAILAQMWKDLAEDQRKEWNKVANQEKKIL